MKKLFFILCPFIFLTSCFRAHLPTVDVVVTNEENLRQPNLSVWVEDGTDTIYLVERKLQQGWYRGRVYNDFELTLHVGNDSIFHPMNIYCEDGSYVKNITVHK